jgi:hypothetical protein
MDAMPSFYMTRLVAGMNWMKYKSKLMDPVLHLNIKCHENS